jgi:hypothetical protein
VLLCVFAAQDRGEGAANTVAPVKLGHWGVHALLYASFLQTMREFNSKSQNSLLIFSLLS